MRDRLIVILLLVLGALVRIDFLYSIDARLDSDEAIVGLMAKHILEGKPIPTFYYGQHYMGSFEALMAALGFYLFGISSWVLQAVPLTFSVLFLWLLYRLALELVSKRAALFCLFLAAFAPATLIIWSTKARGGFIEVMCIGTAALLLAVRWVKSTEKEVSYVIFSGLLLGFGWWVNNQIIYYMLPVAVLGLWSWITERIAFAKIVRVAFFGLIAFFIGGAPYWIYNIQKGFPSLGMFNFASVGEIFEHIYGVISISIPMLMGGKRFWHEEELHLGSVILVWLIVIISLYTYWQTRKLQIKQFCIGKLDCQQPLEILAVFTLVTLSVFCVSSFGHLVQAPRYLLPVYTGSFIFLGYTIDQQMLRKNKSLAFLFCFALLWLSWASSFLGGRTVPGEPFVFKQQRASKNHDQLISWLKENNYSWVRTNYWIGYRLAFETQESIRFLVFAEPHETRIAEYRQASLEHDKSRMPLVLVPAQASYVEAALKAQGYSYSKIELSGYIVLYCIEPIQQGLTLIPANQFEVQVSDRLEYAKLATDRQLDSRWRSARPQSSGMYYKVIFRQPTNIRGIKYETGDWPHDYPRELGIEIEFIDGEKQMLYPVSDYEAIRYYLHGDTTLMFYMDYQQVRSVTLHQSGSHPLLDWSIAELSIYK